MKLTKQLLLIDIILQSILGSIIIWSLFSIWSGPDTSFLLMGIWVALFLWFYQVVISGLFNYFGRGKTLDNSIRYNRGIHLIVNLIVFASFCLILFTEPMLLLFIGPFMVLIVVGFSIYYFVLSVQDYK